MSRSSTRCSSLLALVFAACATAPSTRPSPPRPVEAPAPPRPLVPLSATSLELRDVNLGLDRRQKSSLQLVGDAWASDERRVWAIANTGEGRSMPFLELAHDLWAPSGIVNLGTGWAVAAGRELSFYEGGRVVRWCDAGGSVHFLAPAPNGGVVTVVEGTPRLIVRDQQCLQRWASDALRSVVHANSDWVYGLQAVDEVARLSVADGKPGGVLKLSGRVVSLDHVVGDVLYLVTQEGDGRTKGESATFLERIELSAWKVTAQPLGAQPNEQWRGYDVQSTEQGVIVVAKEKDPASLMTVSSEGPRPLPMPELQDERGFGYSGYLAQVGPRLVVAANGRLNFFDAAAGRLEGTVNLGRSISRIASVDGELLAVTEKALFRIRGTSSPPRASANVASLRARPFQPGAVAALTDGSESTGFEFVDKAVIELTFTRPVVLHKLELAVRNDRPELNARVTKVKFCAREDRSECWESGRREAGAPLMSAPTLTQGVVLELWCAVPHFVPADVGRRCRITELQFE